MESEDVVHVEQSVLSDNAQQCLQGLLRIWFEFERSLGRVPVVQRLVSGRFSQMDYLNLLRHLRQQVIEGSRWISRGASSFDRDFSLVRSMVIGHASDEHRDYQMLEQDYVAAGGQLDEIVNGVRNTGTEALHGFLMYRASQKNPTDLLGAMWIIEGLGQKMASDWARRIDELLQPEKDCSSFMRYHGDNDDGHMSKLYELLDLVCTDSQRVEDIWRTARVVARLYAMQLEDVDGE